LKPIIVDPGLYLSEGTEMFYATQKRELPSAYRVFTGMDGFYCYVFESLHIFGFSFCLFRECQQVHEWKISVLVMIIL